MSGARDASPAGANDHWREMLARWAVPDDILRAAPTSPHFFDPKVFARAADDALERGADSPSDAAAREALPFDGAVLDVGCGAGAASLRLRPGRLTGVDSNGALLDELARRAGRLGIDATTVEGSWPDVAARCAAADVVVCHHVLYNVGDLATFAAALGAHARARVVVEATAVHPLSWMAPYWEVLHGIARPDRPRIQDAICVLAALGLDVHAHRWRRHYQAVDPRDPHALARMARRLCLPAHREGELRPLLDRFPPPVDREVVTLWW